MDNYPGRAPQAQDDPPVKDGQADNNANGSAYGGEQPYYNQPHVPSGSVPGPERNGGYAPPPGTYSQYNPQQPPYAGYPPGAQVPPPPAPPYAWEAYPGQTTAPRPGAGRKTAIIWGLALLALTGSVAAFAVGGEPAKFMEVGLQFLPFALLAMLAYGGVKSSTAGVFAYIWLIVVDVLLLFNVVASVFLAVIKSVDSLTAWEANPQTPLSEVFKPNAGPALIGTFLLLSVVSMISLTMLWRPVRVGLSRIMPIDPDNFVHKIALSILALLLFSSFVPLLVLAGQPPLLTVVNSSSGSLGSDAGLSVRPVDLVYQFAWMIPSTMLAAGWIVSRRFPDVLKRLGMVRPTMLQVITGLVLGVVFAFGANYLDQGIQWLWTTMGWGTTDTGAFSQLMSGVTNPLGAALLGITAGVGEEMAVRGLLQPRIGLIASNLVFTSLHAFQYGFDGLLSVFIVGLIFGIIRARSNTSTSAIVHGMYDFTIVIASFFGW